MLVNNAKRLVRPEELTGASPVDLKGYVSRGFLHFSGAVRYTLKLNGSAGEATATGITIKGEPIDKILDKTFTVAFNSYVGAGAYGEAWNGQTIGAGVKGEIVGYDLKSLPKNDTFLVYRNEIVRYIQEKGVISPETGAKTDGRLTVVQ
jgi:5'-nucleotidase/5'-nucleotidase/UDP-sugar diphosphatase